MKKKNDNVVRWMDGWMDGTREALEKRGPGLGRGGGRRGRGVRDDASGAEGGEGFLTLDGGCFGLGPARTDAFRARPRRASGAGRGVGLIRGGGGVVGVRAVS